MLLTIIIPESFLFWITFPEIRLVLLHKMSNFAANNQFGKHTVLEKHKIRKDGNDRAYKMLRTGAYR